MIYVLNYEQRTPDTDYTKLYSFLEKEMGETAIHVLRDTWWIYIHEPKDIDTLCDKIKNLMGEKDVFYITEISNQPINGWLPSSAWKWFQDNKNKS